ncbi:MAG: zf-TFIIB domain-containing protein [Melioribacteraceae bacterium]|nr:zf-TFIIB domain-containing protein [Melioribacteraceae bacterium]
MNCPHCADTFLQITERQGVEIDYCPKCRGVWLDRGELDKIIEKNQNSYAPPQNEYRQSEDYSRGYDDDGRSSNDSRNGYRRKKKGFLGDLFDFD